MLKTTAGKAKGLWLMLGPLGHDPLGHDPWALQISVQLWTVIFCLEALPKVRDNSQLPQEKKLTFLREIRAGA